MLKSKKKGALVTLCGVAVFVAFWLSGIRTYAYSTDDHPKAEFSADGEVFTIVEPVPTNVDRTPGAAEQDFWYEEDTFAYTGIEYDPVEVGVGQHAYRYSRTGMVPVMYWECIWKNARCIHGDETDPEFHGLNVDMEGKCGTPYYSGWEPVCATCGDSVRTGNHYMDMATAEELQYYNADKGYYYICPYVPNLEQGIDFLPHECLEVSYNRYRVVYIKNAPDTTGNMYESYHMYNNATVFEGQTVTPVTKLSKCTYFRTGYDFVCWTTNPDGTGDRYGDGEEIYNLTDENYSLEEGTGTITLYAQWKRRTSTLVIDAEGGKYEDGLGVYNASTGETTYADIMYGMKLTLDTDANLTPPAGYTVSFDTGTEEEIAPMLADRVFDSWTRTLPFHGRLWEGIYYFIGEDQSTDTITASYKTESIILPTPTKPPSEKLSFGGWYADKEKKKPVGGGGDSYTPKGDETLYAAWTDLHLTSITDLTVDEGKGGVDLTWKQSDMSLKSFKVFQKLSDKGDSAWASIFNTSDLGEEKTKTYRYKGSEETYTVLSSGFYSLRAFGAQGGDYGDDSVSHVGGKGGLVSARVWLNKGDELTINVGGKNGYNGGGTAENGGNGGGRTTIISKELGPLLIAGGGGGATAWADGGMGGSKEYLRADEEADGMSGVAGGGGGGYVGGDAGAYEVHEHDANCYDRINKELVISSYPYVSRSYGSHSSQCSAGSANYHTADDDVGANFLLGSNNPWGITSGGAGVPTEGCTVLQVNIWGSAWGSGGGYLIPSGSFVRLYDQDGNVVSTVVLSQAQTDNIIKPGETWENDNGIWHGTVSTSSYNVTVYFKIPDTMTRMYVDTYLDHGAHDAWITDNISYTLKKDEKICEYEEGDIVKAYPGGGGSNYVIDSAVTSTSEAGVQEGDGFARITASNVGYLLAYALSDVSAHDTAAPDAIDLSKVTMEESGSGAVLVSWQKPLDNGTGYNHQVISYMLGSETEVCRSNITTNLIKTGIKEYYYIYSNSGGLTVTESNKQGSITDEKLRVLIEPAETKYLHLAPVDVAGNVGATTSIEVMASDVEWGVITDQISISSTVGTTDHGSVYHISDKAYYVKADGRTPFNLKFASAMNGSARENYQVDNQIFDIHLEDGSKQQRFITELPHTSITSADSITIPVSQFARSVTGEELLKDAMNSSASRKRYSIDVSFAQAFSALKEHSGKKVIVTPVAGAAHTTDDGHADVKYSDWTLDSANAVILYLDGEAPVVSGLDILQDKELIDRRDGSIHLYATASDTLSGVKDFYIKIYNRDNTVEKLYVPEADGSIRIEITKNEPIFSGDFAVIAYAVDNVGNERIEKYLTTEFSLETSVERILAPHDPIFQCGESGILTITTWGYADRVEVEFPEEMVALNPELNKVYHYTETPNYQQQETLQFMIPLYTPADTEYVITVRAYKGDKLLEERPCLITVSVQGSVLDDIRTRLR